MNETTYRILDILSRRVNIPASINEITKEIGRIHGHAHYADNHKMIKKLGEDKILTLERSGIAWLVSINFDNPMIPDMLAKTELKRKMDFLKGRQEMQMLLQDICTHMHDVLQVSHILLVCPEKNTRLNKVEIIIQLKKCQDKKASEKVKIQIYEILKRLQNMHNIRIDHLALERSAFSAMIKSNERNIIREMLHDKIAILHPQDFWLMVKDMVDDGFKISSIGLMTSPPKISKDDIVFNLARFGYTEFGSVVKHGRLFCMEYVIASIMFHGDTRRMGAIPVVIAKNPKMRYDLLMFLAQKYGFGASLLGILKALREQIGHKMKTIGEPIRILESVDTKEVKADAKYIQERLNLYNVT